MLRLTAHFPDDVVGVSSAGPLGDQLAADLLEIGLTRLVDVYGSSETGGIAVRELPEATYELLPRWQLLPLGRDDWQLSDDKGLHNLPDHVERVGDRSLRPIGRRDGAVQVGGHNVWPQRVVDVLLSTEGVAAAAVRLHANGRLKAFIVPDGSREPGELSIQIERAATDQLSAPERPKSLRFGAALPRNAMGKLEDWA
jgi:4-coumarate--CoA ligase